VLPVAIPGIACVLLAAAGVDEAFELLVFAIAKIATVKPATAASATGRISQLVCFVSIVFLLE